MTFGEQVGEDAAAAYDFGVNFFDCAEAYAAGQVRPKRKLDKSHIPLILYI